MSELTSELTNTKRQWLEDRLYDYACGMVEAKQLKAEFKRLGWYVNLKSGCLFNSQEIVSLETGNVEVISC